MTTHTIISSKHDEGNNLNFTREIEVFLPSASTPGWIGLSFTNHWDDGAGYTFAISRKAAEELMMTLDVMLADNREEEEEADDASLLYTGIHGLPKTERKP